MELYIAASNNDIAGVRDALAVGGRVIVDWEDDDLDGDGDTSLMVAATNGYVEIAKLLLENGADMYKEMPSSHVTLTTRATPTIMAIENGHVEIIKLFLKNGLSPDNIPLIGPTQPDLAWANTKNTLLHHAISFLSGRGGETDTNIQEIILLLLDKGADHTKKNSSGLSPLEMHQAPYQDSYNLIKRHITEPGIKASQRLAFMKAMDSPDSPLKYLGDTELLQSIIEEGTRPGPKVHLNIEEEIKKEGMTSRQYDAILAARRMAAEELTEQHLRDSIAAMRRNARAEAELTEQHQRDSIAAMRRNARAELMGPWRPELTEQQSDAIASMRRNADAELTGGRDSATEMGDAMRRYEDLRYQQSKLKGGRRKKRLTKRSKRITKRSKRLTKRSKRLTKRSKRLTKRSKRLTKRSKRLTKRSRRLTKRSRRRKR
jgi:hypothetical protein